VVYDDAAATDAAPASGPDLGAHLGATDPERVYLSTRHHAVLFACQSLDPLPSGPLPGGASPICHEPTFRLGMPRQKGDQGICGRRTAERHTGRPSERPPRMTSRPGRLDQRHSPTPAGLATYPSPVEIRELSIPGAYEFTPVVHGDDRGSFHEWFRIADFEQALGHALDLKQANCSVSSAGTLRGIHFAQLPPSQSKYVTCLSGAVLDVIVDIRVGSPTYGLWDSVLLDDTDRRCVYLTEGLGHGFLALEDRSIVSYLCSAPYAPGREHGVNPLDPGIGIEWPKVGRDGEPLELLLSDKDSAAPSLAEAEATGLLPTYEEVETFLGSLRA
jgi:dTDP-4-dehydrorhamnose 3,5-epimerase